MLSDGNVSRYNIMRIKRDYKEVSAKSLRIDRYGYFGLARGFESSYAEVIDNFFDFLDVVFESVEAFAKRVIFEIQETKTGVKFVYETRDFDRAIVITTGHAVYGETTLKHGEVYLNCFRLFVKSLK